MPPKRCSPFSVLLFLRCFCFYFISKYLLSYFSNNEEITLNICGSTSINHLNLLSTVFKVIDISDCPYLLAASEQTSSEDEYHIEYESEDGYIYVANAQFELIK